MGEPVIVWVCTNCGKTARTSEGETPLHQKLNTPCYAEIAIHVWHPVAVEGKK